MTIHSSGCQICVSFALEPNSKVHLTHTFQLNLPMMPPSLMRLAQTYSWARLLVQHSRLASDGLTITNSLLQVVRPGFRPVQKSGGQQNLSRSTKQLPLVHKLLRDQSQDSILYHMLLQ